MTAKERMITAFRNGLPDRVPVSPDMSNMIPCRRTGRPFWDIYLHNDPPIGTAYLDAVKHFGFDGWAGEFLGPSPEDRCTQEYRILDRNEDRITRKILCHTPAGTLEQTVVYFRSDPPTSTEKMIKDIANDLPKARYLFPDPSRSSLDALERYRRETGDAGVVGGVVTAPGFHRWQYLFEGGLENIAYQYEDHRPQMLELANVQHEYYLACTRRLLEGRPDYILIAASGALTLQSPALFRELTLPTVKEIARLCREAGIPSHLHCCGRERWLVQTMAEETLLDSIEPLERAPMGDCDLADLKRRFGGRLALKGNLHTTETMLLGTPEQVRTESLRAMLAAGEGGGFVLSTGDQCGRDTPDENIFAMVDAAREFGSYPLDRNAILRELERLDRREGR